MRAEQHWTALARQQPAGREKWLWHFAWQSWNVWGIVSSAELPSSREMSANCRESSRGRL